MISFNTTILKFAEKGEKTGWTYILIPNEISQQINPDQKKSYLSNVIWNHIPSHCRIPGHYFIYSCSHNRSAPAYQSRKKTHC